MFAVRMTKVIMYVPDRGRINIAAARLADHVRGPLAASLDEILHAPTLMEDGVSPLASFRCTLSK